MTLVTSVDDAVEVAYEPVERRAYHRHPMPELKPFKGIRYSSSSDANLKDLICPPYDVISPDEQGELYDRHPNNAVRLELARPDEGGGEV